MHNNVPLHICNEQQFGYITVPLEQDDDIAYDFEHLLNIKMDILNSGKFFCTLYFLFYILFHM